jgi:hypothetical protein
MWTDFPISQDLIDQESDLSQREEQFLIDLADLYEHSTELERASLTIEQAREDLAKRPVDFAQTALNLNSYHRTLSERSRKAHLLLDEPLKISPPKNRMFSVLNRKSALFVLLCLHPITPRFFRLSILANTPLNRNH